MAAATLTQKGQITIPAEIRAKYELTPGTQVEFVDEGGILRLIVRRRVPRTDPSTGFGMIKVPPSAPGKPKRKLSEFDAASLLSKSRKSST